MLRHDMQSECRPANLPSVQVLLAVHNGSEWLDEQLNSIFAQQAVDVSVFACDDGSSDDSLAILARYQLVHPTHLKLHASPGPLGSAARNFLGLLTAACSPSAKVVDYLAFSDQDDLWLPTKLSRAVGEMQRTGASGYSCGVEAFWPDGRIQVMRQCPKTRGADFYFEGAGQGCTFVITTTLARQIAALIKMHPIDVAFHDWLIYALARSLGYHWHFDARPGLRYRQHGTNAIGARASFAGVRRRFALLRSGWYGDEVIKIARACAVLPVQSGSAVAVADLILRARKTRTARIRLCAFIMKHGRRKLSDRFVLCAVAIGYAL